MALDSLGCADKGGLRLRDPHAPASRALALKVHTIILGHKTSLKLIHFPCESYLCGLILRHGEGGLGHLNI